MSLFPSKDKKDLFMTLLKVMGGKKVRVDFAGSGDSGSIESVYLLDSDNNNIDLKRAEFEWEESSSNWNEECKAWDRTRTPKLMSVEEILSRICEDALEQSGLDWYNNEGGQGSLEIDLLSDPVSITLDVGINRMETDHHSFDHTEDEEEEENAPTSP